MSEEKPNAEPKPMQPVSDALLIAAVEAATKLTVEAGSPKLPENWNKNFRRIWNDVRAARNSTVWPSN